MAEQHQSSQIVLEPEQYEKLAQLANERGRTLSEVAQEIVRLGLESIERRKAEQMAILERLNRRRLEYERTHGMCQGNPVAEVRAERENQIDRVMRGEL
jgi:predicted DNA-binding protein